MLNLCVCCRGSFLDWLTLVLQGARSLAASDTFQRPSLKISCGAARADTALFDPDDYWWEEKAADQTPDAVSAAHERFGRPAASSTSPAEQAAASTSASIAANKPAQTQPISAATQPQSKSVKDATVQQRR